MKKLIASILLGVFVLSVFYPTIYGAENVLVNEITEEIPEETEQITNETDIEKKKDDEEETDSPEENEPEIKSEPTDSNEIFEENEEDLKEEQDEIVLETPVEPEKEEVVEEIKIDEQLPILEVQNSPQEQEKVETPEPEQPTMEQMRRSEPENYTGKMYIETPSTVTYTFQEQKNLNIAGWAVANDPAAYMIVVIDGQQVPCSVSRSQRLDVDAVVSPAFGGTRNTPKAGLSININIANLAEGSHTVVVSEVSHLHKIVASSQIQLNLVKPNYTGRMYLETPNVVTCALPDESVMNIAGWTVSNDQAAYMIVVIDGKMYPCTVTRSQRPDVDSQISPAYGGTKNTPKAGLSIKVNVSDLQQGSHTVIVSEVSRFHKVLASSQIKLNITMREYAGKMYIETPNVVTYTLPNQNIMNIAGWAVSNDQAAYMIVVIDGKMYPCTVSRSQRPDVDKQVSPAFGGTKNTPKAGLSIGVNIGDLQDGSHTVVVSEVSRFHKILASAQIRLTVTSPNYTGLMNIETPIQNKRYRSDWLQVSGWAMTEENGDFMKIYLDGQYQAIAQPIQRADVFNVHGSKYPNHNEYAGFISNVNASGLGEGMHKITVQHCSRYGKVIQTKEVPFMISNTTTWGVDVSHHNQTINWDIVKNSGVNFAILKIGEYRESSGAVLVDSKFEENYAACKAHGIAVGGYFYSYAFNPTEAAHEADACTRIISGKSFEMPIFIDIEDKIVTNAVNSGRTNVESLTNAMITFCDIMNSRGYQAGVYSYKNFFEQYLNTPVLERYNIWLAHYISNTDYAGKYDMWQYTSSGNVGGINGFVDLNWCYKHY